MIERAKFVYSRRYGRDYTVSPPASNGSGTSCRPSALTCPSVTGYTVENPSESCTAVPNISDVGSCCAAAVTEKVWTWTTTACYKCDETATIIAAANNVLGYGAIAYDHDSYPPPSASSECALRCESAVVSTILPPPLAHLGCTCWIWNSDTKECALLFNPNTVIVTGALASSEAGRMSQTVPAPSYVREIAYPLGMGMTRNVPTATSTSAYLGTSFDFLWTLGAIGPIPTSITTPAATFVPLSTATGKDVDREANVFGLAVRVMGDLTTNFEYALGGLSTATPLGQFMMTGTDVCTSQFCIVCDGYKR